MMFALDTEEEFAQVRRALQSQWSEHSRIGMHRCPAGRFHHVHIRRKNPLHVQHQEAIGQRHGSEVRVYEWRVGVRTLTLP